MSFTMLRADGDAVAATARDDARTTAAVAPAPKSGAGETVRGGGGVRLFDAFMFFNEFELLALRLAELGPITEAFILVESHRTHRGDPKPLHFLDGATAARKTTAHGSAAASASPPASAEAEQRNREIF